MEIEKKLEEVKKLRNYFWIGVYIKEGNLMKRVAYKGPLPPCREFPLGVGNVGYVGLTGQMKIISDVTKDKQYRMCFVETKSEIVIPIKKDNEIIGVIDVESDKLNYFNEEDVKILNKLAEEILPILLKWK
jgi:GAF domain-containing protein